MQSDGLVSVEKIDIDGKGRKVVFYKSKIKSLDFNLKKEGILLQFDRNDKDHFKWMVKPQINYIERLCYFKITLIFKTTVYYRYSGSLSELSVLNNSTWTVVTKVTSTRTANYSLTRAFQNSGYAKASS